MYERIQRSLDDESEYFNKNHPLTPEANGPRTISTKVLIGIGYSIDTIVSMEYYPMILYPFFQPFKHLSFESIKKDNKT